MNLKGLFATLAGFVTMFITNGILAAVVIGPLFESRYADVVADPASFPLLIVGYLIIAGAMAILYSRLQPTRNWLSQSLVAGALVGTAIFLGAHTVISGYTTLDAPGFILSGLFDSIGPAVGMVTIGYIDQRSKTT